MIPLPEFKKLLGPAGENLTDEEVSHIRDLEYRLANIIFESWLEDRNKPSSGGSVAKK